MTIATARQGKERAPALLGQTLVVIGGSAGIGLETARIAAQNVNFAANCNCRALNIVLGKPKLEFGWNGINRLTFGHGPTGNDGTEHVGSVSVIGVGAKDPA